MVEKITQRTLEQKKKKKRNPSNTLFIVLPIKKN